MVFLVLVAMAANATAYASPCTMGKPLVTQPCHTQMQPTHTCTPLMTMAECYGLGDVNLVAAPDVELHAQPVIQPDFQPVLQLVHPVLINFATAPRAPPWATRQAVTYQSHPYLSQRLLQ